MRRYRTVVACIVAGASAFLSVDGPRDALGAQPLIAPPSNMGHYCSVHEVSTGAWAFYFTGAGTDPCGAHINSNIAHAGMWDMTGQNRVYLRCDDGFKAGFAEPANGDASLQAAFAAAAGKTGCRFNVSANELPIFKKPWSASILNSEVCLPGLSCMYPGFGMDHAYGGTSFTSTQVCRRTLPQKP